MPPSNPNFEQKLQVKQKTRIMTKFVLVVGLLCGIFVMVNFALLFANGLNKLQTPPSPANPGETRTLFTISTDEPFNTLSLNKSFTQDTTIPLNLQKPIIAISASGSVKLNKPDSYARVILVDSENNRYLLYSSDELITNNDYAFSKYCEETCNLSAIKIASLQIQIYEAQLNITSLYYLIDGQNLTKTAEQIKDEQYQDKINRLNEAIKTKGMLWIAGDTEVAKRSFVEREKLVKKDGKLPNMCGFMYYKDGYFEVCESAISLKQENPPANPNITRDPFVFDWRDRHGQDWLTSVKQQMGGDCWAFSIMGATEPVINLYYNQLLNIDLSELDLIACTGQYQGGQVNFGLSYMSNTGVVDEACFPYSYLNLPCSDRCSEWPEKIWKNTPYYPYYWFSNPLQLKNLLIEKGPMPFGYLPWLHAMVFVGFGEITAGVYHNVGIIPETSPYIGTNYFIVKNSYGMSWGQNGYGNMVFPSFYGLNFGVVGTPPILPSSEPPHSIICNDNDNDGYCWWGISPTKPSDCPASCDSQNEVDCDDSDALTGVCPVNYACGSHPWSPSGENYSFGDYSSFGQSACCGDNVGEFPVQGICCNNSNRKNINNQCTPVLMPAPGVGSNINGL